MQPLLCRYTKDNSLQSCQSSPNRVWKRAKIGYLVPLDVGQVYINHPVQGEATDLSFSLVPRSSI